MLPVVIAGCCPQRLSVLILSVVVVSCYCQWLLSVVVVSCCCQLPFVGCCCPLSLPIVVDCCCQLLLWIAVVSYCCQLRLSVVVVISCCCCCQMALSTVVVNNCPLLFRFSYFFGLRRSPEESQEPFWDSKYTLGDPRKLVPEPRHAPQSRSRVHSGGQNSLFSYRKTMNSENKRKSATKK